MIKVFFKAYSSLLFTNSFYLGLLLFLLSFFNYIIAIFGAVAILSTLFFTHIIKMDNKELFHRFYIYNSLLLGMSMGYLYLPSLTTLLSIVPLAILTFLLSLFLSKIMAERGLAILSIPFMLVSVALYFFSLNCPRLLPVALNHEMLFNIEFPLALAALFKAVGSIFFLPNNIVGLVVLIFLLFHSRIFFLLTVLGFYAGVCLHAILLDSFQEALLNRYTFNYAITALSIGAIFLLPILKNFLLALLAVFLSVLVTHILTVYVDYYVLTFPFNFVVILFLFLLHYFKYDSFNYFPLSIPEDTLSQYLSNLKRFQPIKIQLLLPFSGEWEVYQAFDGEWTHQGQWRHAYDFVISEQGSTYKSDGNSLEDYHCYGQAILSPVNGVVLTCNDELFDNPIGFVNEEQNWGNYIVLQTDDGFFVELSHLMKGSLKVKVGDRVKVHTPLAKCGNSGYSSQPHIHVQVQKTEFLGSSTLAFCFYESLHKEQLIFHTLPKLAQRISPLTVNESTSQRFSFLENESYHYKVYKNKKFIENFSFIVKINELGEKYFEDKFFNRLFFYKTYSQFYYYRYEGKESYLKYVYALMPRIPLTKSSISYEDFLSINLFHTGFKKNIFQFWMFFFPNNYMKPMMLTWKNNILSSVHGKVIFSDNSKSFNYLQYNSLELKTK